MVKKMLAITIGVDPGKEGAICVMDDYNTVVYKMPLLTDGKTFDVWWLDDFFRGFIDSDCRVFLEASQPMPKQGVVSVFTYGKHYGSLQTLCAVHKLKCIEIPPVVWTKAMGFRREKITTIIKKGKKAGQKKVVNGPKSSIVYVRRKYPNLDVFTGKNKQLVHDGMTDAVCITEFGRFRYQG